MKKAQGDICFLATLLVLSVHISWQQSKYRSMVLLERCVTLTCLTDNNLQYH